VTGPLLLTVDFEGAGCGVPLPDSPLPRQTDDLLSLFDDLGLRATFFCVGTVAERFPELIRRIGEAGHEVGLHSYAHIPLDRLDPDAFREDTSRGKDAVEQALGLPVRGYRAPFFSLTETTSWAWDVLGELGFEYDSSVLPTRSPVYGFASAPSVPFRLDNGLWEVPMPVVRLGPVGVPVGGGTYLRLIPRPLLDRAIHQRVVRGEPFCLYVHPYDFDGSTGYQPVFGNNVLFNLLLLVGRSRSRDKLVKLAFDRPSMRMGDYVATLGEADVRA